MSDTPMKAIIGANNEVQYVPLTAEEIAQREADMATAEAERIAREAAEAAKADAKLSAMGKLQGLGLTGEEVAALFN
jgi:hypothetical protein